MDTSRLDKIVADYSAGLMSADEMHRALHELFVEDLGHAMVDHSRDLRCGYPEVVFGQGKAPEHVVSIAKRIIERHGVVLITRVSPEARALLQAEFPDGVFHERARLFAVGGLPPSGSLRPVVVVTAGTADLAVAEEALYTARFLGEETNLIADVGVAGLHRLLGRLDEIRRAGVLIVVAGMEGALPSVIGGLVDRPVIAVPTSVGYGSSFEGLSALLGMMNSCASGITVVNIDNGFGAAYAAAVINRGPRGLDRVENEPLRSEQGQIQLLDEETIEPSEEEILPSVAILETNIDNVPPDVIAHAVNRLLSAGALDVTQRPILMKKNRLANAVTVIARIEDKDRLLGFLTEEIPTAGVRVRISKRIEVPREEVRIETPYGTIRVKRFGPHVHPEYEDCRAAAEKHGVPLAKVRESVYDLLKKD